MLSEAKHLLFAESGAGRAISIGLVEEARSLPVEEGPRRWQKWGDGGTV